MELFAGLGLTLHAFAHHGFAPAAAAENRPAKQRALRASFANITIVDDALEFDVDALRAAVRSHAAQRDDASTLDACDTDIAVVSGGVPCQPVAPNGTQQGLNDRRAPLMTDALPRAVAALHARAAEIENHAQFAQLRDGEVLRVVVQKFAAVGFVLARIDFLDAADARAPEVRNRVAIRFERADVAALLGPCPPLAPIRWPRRRILLQHAANSPKGPQ